jgi:hypothetical protein
LLHDEDEKYLQIREKLRSLPRVKASDNFMVSLQHKINLADAETRHLGSTIHKQTHERIHQGTLSRFFGFQQRPWLIPSLSFTVVIFLVLIAVYFGYFNTSGTNDQQVATTNIETTNQTAQNGNNTTNNQSNNTEDGTGNTSFSNAEEKIGNTDSQPGNDEGLLATNDDRLGKTDSYNNKRVNTISKPETETSRSYGNIISSPNNETMIAEPPANTEEMNLDSPTEKPGMVGTVIDGGRTKSAMRPFDENSGVSVDQKKKDSSKNPRNIREVISIGKTDLEELIDALNGE